MVKNREREEIGNRAVYRWAILSEANAGDDS